MGRSQMGALMMEVAMAGQGGRARRMAPGSAGISRSGRWFLIACTLLLAELLLAAVVRAQDAPPKASAAAGASHTVQAGETLWSLAQRYLGNPRRWRDIAQANGLPMDAQRKLPVGRSLVIPGALKGADGTAAAAVDPAPTAPVATVATADTGVSPAAGEPARDEAASRLFLRSARRYELGVREERDPTLPPRDGGSVRAEPAPRRGEALAAPFVAAGGDLARAPRLGDRLALTATAATSYDPLLRLRDRATVRVPKGVTVKPGDRFVAVIPGGGLDKGTLVTPTGELVVEQVGRDLVALVVRQFGRLESGQLLLPAQAEAPPAGARPVAVSGTRVSGTVRHIDADPLLPTLQRYVMLSGGGTWRVGDEVELRTPAGGGGTGRGLVARLASVGTDEALAAARPDQLVGRARVVRVTPLGATAVVTHHDQPRIGEGIVATLVARLP